MIGVYTTSNQLSKRNMEHEVYIAIGSNLGNTTSNITEAIKRCSKFLSVRMTSHLYRTRPQYYIHQPTFTNAVILAKTVLSPIDLLHQLKLVEQQMGRQTSFRYGPRVIDLDILLYDDLQFENNELIIPHEKLTERDFVLVPLCDLCPNKLHPSQKKTILELRKELKNIHVQQVLPIRNMFFELSKRTYIMGILNITPDSFSDGGELYNNVNAAVKKAIQFAKQGADILDIGGQSTRPGAKLLTPEEEMKRVLPVIKAIRSQKELDNVPISIDTFYSQVAKAAIEAGADMINDISGGSFDKDMFATASQLCVPIVIMHMRGTPQTMNNFTDYKDLITDICSSLCLKAKEAQQQGVMKWNCIIDPGIGFAKTAEHNLIILKNISKIREKCSFPLLIGTSRKKFIEKLTGKTNPKQRDFGTSATVCASIAGGADIVSILLLNINL